MQKKSKINDDVGADYSSGVKIEKVFGGYFSDSKNIEDFIKIGIIPILPNLKKQRVVRVADFGGGAGNLARGVKKFLEKHFEKVEFIIVDANPDYLKQARGKGLSTINANLLEHCEKNKYNLIIQRAVLHYNESNKKQEKILENIRKSLKKRGFFVSQLSTGTKENCQMRNEIVNQNGLLPDGGRRTHLWISTEEYLDMLEKIGFPENKISGFAKNGSWVIEEMWDRFNDKTFKELRKREDVMGLENLHQRKKVFFQNSLKIIGKYTEKNSYETLGVENLTDDYRVNYQYPIVISKK